MQPWSTPQLTFQAGAVGADFIMRRDTAAWKGAASQLDNTWPMLEGGIKRRPGTLYKASLTAISNTIWSRLIPFEFDDSEKFVLAFTSTGGCCVFDGDLVSLGFATAAGTAYSPMLPSSAAWVDEFDYAVIGNSIILVHKDYKIRVIKRTVSGWTIDRFFYAGVTLIEIRNAEPWIQATSGISITPSATSGFITLTASSALFESDVPNSRTKWLQFMEGITAGADGALVEVTSYTSPTVAGAVVRSGTLASTSATGDYKEMVYEGAEGAGTGNWPHAVWVVENRLVFASAYDDPGFIAMSRPGFMKDFRVGTAEAGDGILFRVAGSETQQIQYGIDASRHHVFTERAFMADRSRRTGALETGTVSLHEQDRIGAARVKPEVYDGNVCYVDSQRNAIRECLIETDDGKMLAGMLSFLAKDIIIDPQRMAVFDGTAEDPEKLLAVVNSDGSMAVCLSIKSENVTGWRKWTTDGWFRDAVRFGDQLVCIVQRTISGSTRYYLEAFDSSAYVDSAVATGGANNYSVGHLTGKDIERVLAGDSTGVSPTTGQANGTNHDQAGLEFEAVIETLPLDGILSGFPMYGRVKRIITVSLQIDRCTGILIDGARPKWREFIPDTPGGDKGRLRKTKLGFDKDHRITISLPSACRGAILGYSIETRVSTIPNG